MEQAQENKKELTPIQEKRQKLKALSNEVKEGLEEGEKVNDLIIEHYMTENPDIEKFNTYKGWLKEGYQVKKGETAFLVWGRPKNTQEGKQEKAPVPEGEEEDSFFPVAYIFSNLQVRKIEKSEAA